MKMPVIQVILTTTSPSAELWWEGHELIATLDEEASLLSGGHCIGLAATDGVLLEVSGAAREDVVRTIEIYLQCWKGFASGLQAVLRRVDKSPFYKRRKPVAPTGAEAARMTRLFFDLLPSSTVIASRLGTRSGMPQFAAKLGKKSERKQLWKSIRGRRLDMRECFIFPSAAVYMKWQAEIRAWAKTHPI